MKEEIYESKPWLSKNSYVKSMTEYRKLYRKSVESPVEFWSDIAKQFHWETPIDVNKFWSYNFDVRKGPVHIKWLEGASTNICYNLLDRNIKLGYGEKIAFYWEGNDPEDYSRLTYKKLREEVCKFANVLKSKGVTKGDRVAIYMPMILEIVIVILACSRIGAVHSIVFAGFSADALADRIVDCKCKVLVTADSVYRGDKLLHLKPICDTGKYNVTLSEEVCRTHLEMRVLQHTRQLNCACCYDAAMERAKHEGHEVSVCIVVRHLQRLNACSESAVDLISSRNMNGDRIDDGSTGIDQCSSKVTQSWNEDRDVWWHEEMEVAEPSCYPVWVSSEDPLFMLYTSGSTGKPKGVLHTVGGYLLYAATTFKYVFDYKPANDIYWCTADVGWITGHTYVVYGPLANAATSIIFEGTPFYPSVDRFWSIIQKYKVNQFYTAPTAIRALMKYGDEHPRKYDLSSLKVLGSVGEPINPEAWLWYYQLIGREKCSIVDTFWQTETGGHVITPLPGCTPMKPGSATFPFFGVQPELLDENGEKIEGEGEGYLVFNRPWPGMMRTLFGNHERFEETYFTRFPGYYCTGDGARRDADGYFWITGRIDDKLNVSGHLMSTAEVESCLTEHSSVSEAAVVSRPHVVKGECLYCFVTPNDGVKFDNHLVSELTAKVREKIGPFAMPDVIQYAPSLPKTRSGKIMRRILRKIAVDDRNVGDTSTLADESIVEILFKNRPESKKADVPAPTTS